MKKGFTIKAILLSVLIMLSGNFIGLSQGNDSPKLPEGLTELLVVEFADQSYFLIDSLNLENLTKADGYLLDSCLKIYHSANHDTDKVNVLSWLCEFMVDQSHWKYEYFLCDFVEKAVPKYTNGPVTNRLKIALVESYSYLAMFHSSRGDPKSSLDYYRKCLKLSQEIDFTMGIAGSYDAIAGVMNAIGDVDSAMKYYDKSLALSQQIGDTGTIAQYYINVGYLYQSQGEIAVAFEHYSKGAKLIEELTKSSNPSTARISKARLSTAYNNIGLIYYRQGGSVLALNYFFKSLQLSEQIVDQEAIVNTYCNIGAVYKLQGDFKLELEYHNKALKLAKEIEFRGGLASIYNNIASYHSRQGNMELVFVNLTTSLKLSEEMGYKSGLAQVCNSMGIYYQDMGDTPRGLEYLHRGLKLRQELKDTEGMAESHSYIGLVELAREAYKVAKEHLTKGLELAREVGNTEVQSRASLFLSKLAQKQGNWQEAMEMYKLHVIMRDSIKNEQTQTNAIKQQARYELEKTVISMEQTRKDELRQADQELSKSQSDLEQKKVENTRAYIFLLISALTLVIIGLLAWKLRSSNKQLTKRNKEKDTLMQEIHHRVKNNLQIIHNLLELQTKGVDDESTLSVMREGQNRVQAMALIHKKLYQSENLENINFQEYTKDLCATLHQIYGGKNKEMSHDIKTQDISFDIDTAVPLGLILNELVTNTYKYAFSSVENPSLKIRLTNPEEGNYILKVSDKGTGLPEGLDLEKIKSLGLRLVGRLSKQLAGKFIYENVESPTFVVYFKDTLARKQID